MSHDFSAEIDAAFAAFESTRDKVVALPLVRFEAGPYHPPAVQVGDEVECAYYGAVRIVGWSQGALPWPQCHISGPRSMILFEDLACAVVRESVLAISLAWRVSPDRVTKWRHCLDVGRNNEGSKARHRAIVTRVISPAQNAAGLERAHSIPTRIKAEATRQARTPPCPRWTPAIVALMGVATDVEIGVRIGCHATIVGTERRRRGIAATSRSGRFDLLRLDGQKLRQRRYALGLTQFDVATRYGCNNAHISIYERHGIQPVTPETLEKFARALKCQPDDLLADDSTDAGANGDASNADI